jgi:hypothetical protein
LIKGLSLASLMYAVFALIVITGATMILNVTIPRPENYSIERYPWLKQTIIGSVASVLCLLPLYFIKG